jgi:hypothetical protein
MKQPVRKRPFIKCTYYRFIALFRLMLETLDPPKTIDYHEIPVFINNFNRLDSMKQLIGALEARGYHNINIIDNDSTYPPLLEYYKTCNHNVILLGQNLGMNAFWLSGLYRKYRKDYFVYTDSDVVPVEECPDDFLNFFLQTLKKHRLATKVGFSLKIDDLPGHYAHRDQVIEWEQQFFEGECIDNILYRAPIDTTFALYRPRAKRRHANGCIEMYRAGFPYMARHLPWYIDSYNPDEENRYYIENVKIKTTWSRKGKSLLS